MVRGRQHALAAQGCQDQTAPEARRVTEAYTIWGGETVSANALLPKTKLQCSLMFLVGQGLADAVMPILHEQQDRAPGRRSHHLA